MKRIILCSPIYDFKEKRFTIGGIQTYIRDLADICANNGIKPLLIQMREDYDSFEEIECENINIIKYPAIKSFGKYSAQKVFEEVYKTYNDKETIFVIDTDQRDIKSSAKNVVVIQHGIAFDIPGNMISGFWGKTRYLQNINKLLRCIKNANRQKNICNTVCVDYNYFNWLRTISTISGKVVVIPNYSSSKLTVDEVTNKIQRMSKPLNIVFARRFVDYRGTIIFKNAILRLFNEGYNFKVTFSGSGPLYNEIVSEFRNNQNVFFMSYNSKDSIKFHKEYDISVVPTIFSEGTSLSLCEAMSSGCVPIATHVGGMTNMILDGYNGYLCYPSENDLYRCLKDVLNKDLDDLRKIAVNAYDSATTSFTKEKWGSSWLKYLDIIYNELN